MRDMKTVTDRVTERKITAGLSDKLSERTLF